MEIISLFASISVLQANLQNKKFCPVGKLLPGVKVVILNDDLEAQPRGVAGEVNSFLLSINDHHSPFTVEMCICVLILPFFFTIHGDFLLFHPCDLMSELLIISQ